MLQHCTLSVDATVQFQLHVQLSDVTRAHRDTV